MFNQELQRHVWLLYKRKKLQFKTKKDFLMKEFHAPSLSLWYVNGNWMTIYLYPQQEFIKERLDQGNLNPF